MRSLPRIQRVICHLKRLSLQRGESILKLYPFARRPKAALAAKWRTIAVVAVAPVLLLSTRKAPAPAGPITAEPVRSIPLTLTGEGGRLSLGWAREARAVQTGQCGILWITDGGIQRRLILDASQLRAGKLFYWPANKDVSFEIQLAEGENRGGETVCGNEATAQREPAERPAGREQRVETPSRNRLNPSGNRLNRVQVAQRQSIESGRSSEAGSHWNGPIKSSQAPALTPAFTIEGESQLVATAPVRATPVQAASRTPVLSTAIRPAPTPEPHSTVTVEAVPESRLGRLASKIPLLRRLRRPPEFLPPRPVRETTPAVPAELGRTLRGEVPLDVRAYINESGKVTYAEMMSNVTEANRRLASLAVFDARRWVFMPAQLGKQRVAGQVILHYRFGNPLLAVAGRQR
jgi:hypothetical protein